ncbi:L-aspartate oxidase [Halobacillus sp. Marseille-Q1614]|uniref:L-aspartate oxidase n=1 Tax=Halobacillus sp. Marseille-Q1614 TaxID=2709134 RepID=UPI00156DB022|nr:L-aspartate oxidase [Halobacillus sp. Marseille-Q1614]
MEPKVMETEVVIIGSGIAGLLTALELPAEKKVVLVTKSALGAGNSSKAQGGIAAALGRNDSVELHIEDTVEAGRYVNARNIVTNILKQAPQVMEKLISLGVAFDKNRGGEFDLAKEGAHSSRRIYHAGGDATGWHIIEQLKKRITKNVEVLELFNAYDLVMKEGRCTGVRGKNKEGEPVVIFADATIVAAGGCGQLYSITSNAEESTGDGLAMAYRAGAKLVDMEYMQFHPTMLFARGRGAGLLSEAIRGEGGILVDEFNHSIMKDRHPLKDLAPRSVTSLAVYENLKSGREVFLSIKNVPDFPERFPTIAGRVLAEGINLAGNLLPVRPGAHFMMGGIAANEWGETSIKGLYAIGEAACTGLHGANRLASNSLLEAAASALLLGSRLKHEGLSVEKASQVHWPLSSVPPILPELGELKGRMDEWAGIVKTKENLLQMREWLVNFQPYLLRSASFELTEEQLTIKNMLTVAWMVINSALERTESRGAHIRADYPTESEKWSSLSINWEGGSLKPSIEKKRSGHERNRYDEPVIN